MLLATSETWVASSTVAVAAPLVAVDSTSAYWTNSGIDTVMKVPLTGTRRGAAVGEGPVLMLPGGVGHDRWIVVTLAKPIQAPSRGSRGRPDLDQRGSGACSEALVDAHVERA